MTKTVYIKCPRCDLNFIQKRDKLCSVCKTEMQALATNYTDDAGNMGLCPICKANYIADEETVCETCIGESELTEDEIDALYGGIEVDKDGEEITDDGDELEMLGMEMGEEMSEEDLDDDDDDLLGESDDFDNDDKD